MVLVQQMVVLFILMGVGFFCGKKGFITDSFARNISWLVVNIATPAMILSAGMNDEVSIRGEMLAFGFFVAILVYLLLIALSFVILPAIRVPAEDKNVYRVMTIFSNIGFMGLPIISAAYGQEAVLYGALFQFPYNILMYTYGIAAMTKDTPFKSKEGLKRILNIGVISSVLALVIYVFDIHVPEFIKIASDHLDDLAAPLSMMVIGQSMIHLSPEDIFGDVRLMVFSLIKLIAVPIIGVLILNPIISDDMILKVCYIMLATPVGSLTAIVAQQYGGNYSLASKGVALSTILSVATIPIVSLVLFGA